MRGAPDGQGASGAIAIVHFRKTPMPVHSESHRSMPFLDAFSARDRKAVDAACSRRDDMHRKDVEARTRTSAKLVAATRSRLRAALGERKATALREAMTRERVAFRDLWQPPLDPARDYRKENTARKRRVDAVLRTLGSDAATVRLIGRVFDEQVQALAKAGRAKVVPGFSMAGHRDRWAKLSRLNEYALPWGGVLEVDDPDDPHRWTLFRPPFFGFNFQFASWGTGGYFADRIHMVDPVAGLVGYEARLTGSNDDQYELGGLGVLSAIAFGFQAPATGLIEILVDAQCAFGHHHVRMDDDWGWSDSTTRQRNYLSLDVLHPNAPDANHALMADFRADGNDETIDRDLLVPGQHYFAQAVSTGSVSAGTSVVVQIGTFGDDASALDDVDVHSVSTFRWFVSSVQVRIAP